MIYIDTSVLGALFFLEPGSEDLLDQLKESRREGLMISAWTITEMATTAAIKKRTGAADDEICQRALSNFQRFASETLQTTEVAPQDFRSAFDLILRQPLKSGDALHLAIAMRCQARLFTLDKRLLSAALAMGVPDARR